MSSGLPYTRDVTLAVVEDPGVGEIKVPPRGHIRRIYARQRGGTDAFTMALYTVDPAASASVSVDGIPAELFKIGEWTATAGLISELTLDVPYDLQVRDSVGRVIPILYAEFTGVTTPDSVDVVMTIDIPNSRA